MDRNSRNPVRMTRSFYPLSLSYPVLSSIILDIHDFDSTTHEPRSRHGFERYRSAVQLSASVSSVPRRATHLDETSLKTSIPNPNIASLS